MPSALPFEDTDGPVAQVNRAAGATPPAAGANMFEVVKGGNGSS